MDKVASCLAELPSLFKAFLKQDAQKIEEISLKISQLEHEADLTKNDIRNHLPKSLFLPLDRGALLEILALQDTLADQAEEVAMCMRLSPLELPSFMHDDFSLFCQKNLHIFLTK